MLTGAGELCGTLLPFELWLGRGRPLNPYLKGLMVEYKSVLEPKDLRDVPDNYLRYEDLEREL